MHVALMRNRLRDLEIKSGKTNKRLMFDQSPHFPCFQGLAGVSFEPKEVTRANFETSERQLAHKH